MKKIILTALVWPEGEDFVAQCLDYDVSSFGDTVEDAIANLAKSLEL